jgi:hypothetical protein
MRIFLAVAFLMLGASGALAQSINQGPAERPSVDQGPVECRDFAFPFSVLCIANLAAYREPRWCDEVIGQTAVMRPAGQQCEAEPEPERREIERLRLETR